MLGALEMHESPEVAILQHASGVMQVAYNVFENGSKLLRSRALKSANDWKSPTSPTSSTFQFSLLSEMAIALL